MSLIGRGVVKDMVVASHKIPTEKLEEAARICERTRTWMRQVVIDFRAETDQEPNNHG